MKEHMRLLAQTFFGDIQSPEALRSYGATGGLIVFASNIIRLVVIAGGLFALWNMISAGFMYITSQGDPKATEKTLSTLTMSLLGLILMIAAPALAAIIGFVLFNDPTFILRPQLQGPNSTPSSLLMEYILYA